MRRNNRQRKLPHTPKTAAPRPRAFVGARGWPQLESCSSWGELPLLVGRALFALGVRYNFASFTRAGVTPLVRARAIVAHDRILTGDPRHGQA